MSNNSKTNQITNPNDEFTHSYYLILISNFLFSIAFIPMIYEVLNTKITINIPYLTLIPLFIAFLFLLFVSVVKKYWIHVFIYFIGLFSISIILFLKKDFDAISGKEKITDVIKNKIKNKIKDIIDDEGDSDEGDSDEGDIDEGDSDEGDNDEGDSDEGGSDEKYSNEEDSE